MNKKVKRFLETLMKENILKEAPGLGKKPLFEVTLDFAKKKVKKENEKVREAHEEDAKARYLQRQNQRKLFYDFENQRNAKLSFQFFFAARNETFKKTYDEFIEHIEVR